MLYYDIKIIFSFGAIFHTAPSLCAAGADLHGGGADGTLFSVAGEEKFGVGGKSDFGDWTDAFGRYAIEGGV